MKIFFNEFETGKKRDHGHLQFTNSIITIYLSISGTFIQFCLQLNKNLLKTFLLITDSQTR